MLYNVSGTDVVVGRDEAITLVSSLSSRQVMQLVKIFLVTSALGFYLLLCWFSPETIQLNSRLHWLFLQDRKGRHI
jgi:TRAP-type C4-dicarboxylate transport system permease small subunit